MKALNYSMISALVLMAITFSFSTSCNKDKTPAPVPLECPDTIFFGAVVEPMIQQNCATSGCHSASSAAGGYNLVGHVNISANATIILNVIRHEVGFTAMPYFQPKLNDTIIQQFKCWMDQGKLNN
jgi:hypothetical protein